MTDLEQTFSIVSRHFKLSPEEHLRAMESAMRDKKRALDCYGSIVASLQRGHKGEYHARNERL